MIMMTVLNCDLCDEALQNMYSKMTFTKVKVKIKGHQKMTLPYFSETFKDTDIKFGSKVLCDVAHHIICSTVTFTQGQGHKGDGQMPPKSNFAIFPGNY